MSFISGVPFLENMSHLRRILKVRSTNKNGTHLVTIQITTLRNRFLAFKFKTEAIEIEAHRKLLNLNFEITRSQT